MKTQVFSANMPVGTQGAGISPVAKGTGAAASLAKPQSNAPDFGSLLKSGQSAGSAKPGQSTGSQTAKADRAADSRAGAKDASDKTANNAAEKAAAQVSKKDSQGRAKPDSAEKLDSFDENAGQEVSDEVMEAAAVLASQLVCLVSEVTGVSREELSGVMEELGISAGDLMDSGSLKQLLMQLNGSDDVTDFLTNEEMAQAFSEISDGISELLSQSFPDMPDGQLAAALEGVKEGKAYETFSQMPEEEAVQTDVDAAAQDGLPDIQIDDQRISSSQTQENGQQRESHQGAKHDTAHLTQSQAFNQFVNNLAEFSVDSFGEQAGDVPVMREIVTQVVDQIRITIRQETTTMELQLNPENLGKVNLAVAAKNGQMTATFTVTNEMARKALESQIQVLKDTFEEQGLKVEAVEVNVSEFAFEQSQGNSQNQQGHQKKAQRSFNLEDLQDSSLEDLTDEEQIAVERMNANGSSVDYTA